MNNKLTKIGLIIALIASALVIINVGIIQLFLPNVAEISLTIFRSPVRMFIRLMLWTGLLLGLASYLNFDKIVSKISFILMMGIPLFIICFSAMLISDKISENKDVTFVAILIPIAIIGIILGIISFFIYRDKEQKIIKLPFITFIVAVAGCCCCSIGSMFGDPTVKTIGYILLSVGYTLILVGIISGIMTLKNKPVNLSFYTVVLVFVMFSINVIQFYQGYNPNKATIRMGGSGTASIDWGDGSVSKSRNLSSVYDVIFKHEYSDSIRNVTVTGNGITHLMCINNKLTSLDVSKNTALTRLDCDANRLTSLDVSKNIALKDLSCGGNELSADALNALFETLHSNSVAGEKRIHIGSHYYPSPPNPGAKDCNTKIAKDKGWTMD